MKYGLSTKSVLENMLEKSIIQNLLDKGMSSNDKNVQEVYKAYNAIISYPQKEFDKDVEVQ